MHSATIYWKSDGNFISGKYSRAHEWHFDGGAVVRGSSSPSVVMPPMSDPTGVDPEEALIASASACHMLWFLSLAHRAGLDVTSYQDKASAILGKNGDGKIAITHIILRPDIVYAGRQPTGEEVGHIHHEAHEKCFIANSLRCQISIESPVE